MRLIKLVSSLLTTPALVRQPRKMLHFVAELQTLQNTCVSGIYSVSFTNLYKNNNYRSLHAYLIESSNYFMCFSSCTNPPLTIG